MRFMEIATPVARLFARRTRRCSVGSQRAQIEYRQINSAELEVFKASLKELAAEYPAITRVDVNAFTQRVVVSFEEFDAAAPELLRFVEEAELAARVDRAELRASEDHPTDLEPPLRRSVELGVAALSLATSVGLKISPLPTVPFAGNTAAALSILRSSPRLRRGLEERLGRDRTGFLLNLASSVTNVAAQRPSSAFVESLHRLSLLGESMSRRAAWSERDDELHELIPPENEEMLEEHTRPREMTRGPIEEYADRAWFISLSGFAASFVTTRNLQRATAALFGGVPRPARLGRDVFAADLARVLAARGTVVMDPAALRLLDRVDCVVLDSDVVYKHQFVVGEVVGDVAIPADANSRATALFDVGDPLAVKEDGGYRLGPIPLLDAVISEGMAARGAELARDGALVLGLASEGRVLAVVQVTITAKTGVEELVDTAQSSGLRVVIASSDEAILQSLNADDVISDREGLTQGIRRLQRDGRTVCLVSGHTSAGFAAADCVIGLCPEGQRPPWGAALLVRSDLSDVRYILESCRVARQVSRQSVNVALGAASLGAVVSAGGLLPLRAARVLSVVNLATLTSMANGVRHSSALRRKELPPPRDPTPWHALHPQGALARLHTSEQGLSSKQLVPRKPEAPKLAAAGELVAAITDEMFNPLAPVLAAGAGLSAVVGSVTDAAMVAGVVVVNAVAGGTQRFVAERKLREMRRGKRRFARVRRDGLEYRIDAVELVCGDLVMVGPGDVIPADLRILESTSLEVDASSLTGESLPVAKSGEASFESQIADRRCMLYEGTTVAAGTATAVVVAVGQATEAHRGAGKTELSAQGGVEQRLRALMNLTGPIALTAGLGVVGAGLVRGRRLKDLVESGVSLAVASVPEGLPMLATAAQLAAAQRLGKHGALVRNIRALEALGRVDTVCVDKTGTLTLGRLELHALSDGDSEMPVEKLRGHLLEAIAAASRATLGPDHPLSDSDPTDNAVRRAARLAGMTPDYRVPGWERLSEVSFEAGRSYHAVLADTDAAPRISVKGAPEALLPVCTEEIRDGERVPLTGVRRAELSDTVSQMGRRGLRVLGVAEKTHTSTEPLSPDDITELCFGGLLLFTDPVRQEARAALEGLRETGTELIMITGDHPSTAEAIAVQLGMLLNRSVLTGGELAQLSDRDVDKRVANVAVFARMTPSQKVRIVRALQRAGRVVAMVGDGANDAAAIRLADVGIAMGEQSTAAAREAADIVLSDGRLHTLVEAIVEGRGMWDSVHDAVSILMGGNFGEIAFTLGAGLIDGRPPLHARQLLLVNLLTDIAPAMAIAVRPPSAERMTVLRQKPTESTLDEELTADMVGRAAVTALGASSAFFASRLMGGGAKARTTGLLALVGTQLGQTLRAGHGSRSVQRTSLGSAVLLAAVVQTPGVSHFFGCRPLGPVGWATAIGASVGATAASPYVDNWLSGSRMAALQGLTRRFRGSDLVLELERGVDSAEPA